jgi:hypothetical protein
MLRLACNAWRPWNDWKIGCGSAAGEMGAANWGLSMGRMLGSDPDQLDRLGDALARSADRLNAIGGEVSSLLAYAGWDGGDADEFHWHWHHQLTGILRATAVQNDEAARILHRNAQEQRAASADHFGGGFPGVWLSSGWPPPGSDFDLWSGLHPGFDFSLDLAALIGSAATAAELLNRTFDAMKAPAHLAGFAGLVGNVARWSKRWLPAPVSVLVDGTAFVHGIFEHPNDPKTVNAGVDTALSVLELGLLAGGVVCPPLLGFAVATKAVHFGFDAIAAIDPALPTQIANGMSDFVADKVGDAADAVGDAAEAAAGVVSGGVNSVANFLGF